MSALGQVWALFEEKEKLEAKAAEAAEKAAEAKEASSPLINDKDAKVLQNAVSDLITVGVNLVNKLNMDPAMLEEVLNKVGEMETEFPISEQKQRLVDLFKEIIMPGMEATVTTSASSEAEAVDICGEAAVAEGLQNASGVVSREGESLSDDCIIADAKDITSKVSVVDTTEAARESAAILANPKVKGK